MTAVLLVGVLVVAPLAMYVVAMWKYPGGRA